MANTLIGGGWYDTQVPYARHARINGRHYVVYSTETPREPRTAVDCDGERITVLTGTIYDSNERSDAGMRLAEQDAMSRDSRVEFGANPAPVPEEVSRIVG